MRWDGQHWKVASSPNVGNGSNDLAAIGGSSAANLYAVGLTITGSDSAVLILHWNGKHWGVVKGQNPGTAGNNLNAVYTPSPTSAWAVGSFSDGSHNRTLIEHCGK